MWLKFTDILNTQKETIEGRDFISIWGNLISLARHARCALLGASIAYSGSSGFDGDTECCKIEKEKSSIKPQGLSTNTHYGFDQLWNKG